MALSWLCHPSWWVLAGTPLSWSNSTFSPIPDGQALWLKTINLWHETTVRWWISWSHRNKCIFNLVDFYTSYVMVLGNAVIDRQCSVVVNSWFYCWALCYRVSNQYEPVKIEDFQEYLQEHSQLKPPNIGPYKVIKGTKKLNTNSATILDIASILDIVKLGQRYQSGSFAALIDWSKDHQSHKLGLQSFIDNWVSPSIIPILLSFFQDRKMKVKWNNSLKTSRDLFSGGPQQMWK